MAVRALLISTYDLGHQPFGLASPAAWLRREGLQVVCADLSKEKLGDDTVKTADFVGFHLPMHTATRLAVPVIRRVRSLNADAHICAYGLYAPLNEEYLRSIGVNHVLGGEFESELTALATRASPVSDRSLTPSLSGDVRQVSDTLPKLQFIQPDRSGLLALTRYAKVHLANGEERVAGYTEASRGCRHLCRHCPVVPIYNGQFRVVQFDVVMADINSQVAAGAQHITFGDPDFFNGPTHAIRIVEALHRAHPTVTYDVTIKVEHLLQHSALLPRLAVTGCLFVTSAVEAVDDRVLRILDKGHTRRDFVAAVELCRRASVTLMPTFVAFHPWLSLDDYCDLLDTIASLHLVDHVAPIQLAIRLLIPSGSRLLQLPDVQPLVGEFDAKTLSFRWSHRDRRVDTLQHDVAAIVGRRLTSSRREAFRAISELAHRRAGQPTQVVVDDQTPGAVPFLDEPWYCCAEPNPEQLLLV